MPIGLIFPDPTNNTITFLDKLYYINSLTDVGFGGVLGLCLILVVGFGLFFMLKSFKFEYAFATAAFITAIFTVFFRILDLVNDTILYSTIIIFVISYILLRKISSQGEV